jgi:hypothetical protein
VAKKSAPSSVPILNPPPTPAELRELMRATLDEWFPNCEVASLIVVPAPGCSPLELTVLGRVTNALGQLGDVWTSEYNGGDWSPVEDTD